MTKETAGFLYVPRAVPAELMTLSGGPPHDAYILAREEICFGKGAQSGVPELVHTGLEDARQLAVHKRMGAGKGLSHTEASKLLDDWLRYRDVLGNAGWVIPGLFEAHCEEWPDGYVIDATEEFIVSRNGEQLLADPRGRPETKWSLMAQTTTALYRSTQFRRRQTTANGHTVTALPYGVDLKPSNLILDYEDTGVLVLVDTFGPKLMDGRDGLQYEPKLEQYGQEAIELLCGTREGCLLRFWRAAEQLWLTAESDAPVDAVNRLQQLRDMFLGYVQMQCELYGAPTTEFEFIRQEVITGYPWLRSVIAKT